MLDIGLLGHICTKGYSGRRRVLRQDRQASHLFSWPCIAVSCPRGAPRPGSNCKQGHEKATGEETSRNAVGLRSKAANSQSQDFYHANPSPAGRRWAGLELARHVLALHTTTTGWVDKAAPAVSGTLRPASCSEGGSSVKYGLVRQLKAGQVAGAAGVAGAGAGRLC